MTIKIIVKAKFNAAKESIEQFGNNRYLVYVMDPEDDRANIALVMKLSRYLGVPPTKIVFAGLDPHKDRVFKVL